MNLRPQGENARRRQAGGMTDAEAPSRHPQRSGGPCGAPGEIDLRRRAWSAMNDHVAEGDPCTEARAERLEHCLFGGEPSGQTLDAVGTVADFFEFGLHETARDQGIARIFNPATKFGNLHEIDSMSDYIHARQ
ncbi:hypothetical protein RHIZO_00724 [Rhizobiaceae bacterium]|nr:hypothetical protein RHIZO_00724 [Rhizobiaceae bacterium]